MAVLSLTPGPSPFSARNSTTADGRLSRMGSTRRAVPTKQAARTNRSPPARFLGVEGENQELIVAFEVVQQRRPQDDVAASRAVGKIDLDARKRSARQPEVGDAGLDNLPQRKRTEPDRGYCERRHREHPQR
jgi:hypothetical protein